MTARQLPPLCAAQLDYALKLTEVGQLVQAERIYREVTRQWPQYPEAWVQLAHLAMAAGDSMRASQLLEEARQRDPDRPGIALKLAFAYARSARPAAARKVLEATVEQHEDFHAGWLLLSEVLDTLGEVERANSALFQAIWNAQHQGLWLDERSTPPPMRQTVIDAMERVRRWRRTLFFDAYAQLRERYGDTELRRVDRALTGYLREWDATPPDSRQRPKFLYFPDLPSTPFLDPYLHPWATRLEAAFPAIRAEAAQLLAEQAPLSDFLTFKPGDRTEDYLSGTLPNPSWDAFFFYRHGQRYDDNHARCPQTSAALESIELCRIRDQTPEICFSVLSAGTHIKPHFGVTNTRVVLHLPLIVPADCALRIVDDQTHHWQEGQLMMFDDTFQHEAWNRSSKTRVILLMDAWNPHLSEVERQALTVLVEAISDARWRGKDRLDRSRLVSAS